ncbi:GTPase [Candidatus Woesearchaeota archaeon]|nr:GTPase [Candidatus Woesearchaeota archaeon]
MVTRNVLILGAAGRDFHNFNVFFRGRPDYRVVGFTATQIPGIAGRKYPAELAGRKYPKGIQIYQERDMEKLIKKYKVHDVVFSYSDVTHEYVMHLASRVLAAGANFMLLGPGSTMIKSSKPLISVCATRTGAGKSQVTRAIAGILRDMGKKVAIIRHPMPYGDLRKQAVQRFASYRDLEKQNCTIEEREEYETHISKGFTVYAGVDYEKILRLAEKESDVIIFDGGNNDFSFYSPDMYIVVADPHRPGHELAYHPGETNARMADIVIVNKVDSARKRDVNTVVKNITSINPAAKIILARSDVTVDRPEMIRNKNVVIVADGPTLSHGGMPYSAGSVAAKMYGCRTVDARKYAVGSIKEMYKNYPHVRELPAMGYSNRQIKELEKTINAVKCDAVLNATPADITRLMKINKPVAKVSYELGKAAVGKLRKMIARSF